MQGGLRLRSRSCSNPEPKFGGQGCQGEMKQMMTCGPTCQTVFVLGLNEKDSSIYTIDQTIDYIEPKLPPKSDLEQTDAQFDRSNILYWRNGILICPRFRNENCQHWDFNECKWTDMKSRPFHEHSVCGLLVINGKWMVACGRNSIGTIADTE